VLSGVQFLRHEFRNQLKNCFICPWFGYCRCIVCYAAYHHGQLPSAPPSWRSSRPFLDQVFHMTDFIILCPTTEHWWPSKQICSKQVFICINLLPIFCIPYHTLILSDLLDTSVCYKNWKSIKQFSIFKMDLFPFHSHP